MGACTKIKRTRLEGMSVDSLFRHGFLSVDTYYRYLIERSEMVRKGIRPRAAVGTMKDGVLDYKFTDRIEMDSGPDTYAIGACPNFMCPTWKEIEEFSRTEESRNIEMWRRVNLKSPRVGNVEFDNDDDISDYITRKIEEA